MTLTPSTGAPRPLALTRWFAGVGALLIALFSIAMSAVLSHFLATRMLERDAALSRDFVQSIADIQQVAGFLEHPVGTPAPSSSEFFSHVAAMPDVLRANIYGADRRLRWSSRSELIGQTFADNDELDDALKGEVVVHRDEAGRDAPKAEHRGLRPAPHGFIENYLPIRGADGRQLVAVVELYRQPDALFDAIDSGQRLIWLTGALGGLGLFMLLLGFVRRTERAMQRQQARLVDAEAMAIVGELTAAVAHSIRNPLGSIRSTAELQRELQGDPGGEQAELIRNVDRIEHLVRTLLQYAADPREHQSSADVAAVLRDAARRIAPQLAQQGTALVLEIDDGAGLVGTDPVVLAQVFNSLLSNAAEACGRGDTVTLRTQAAAGLIHVEVADTGGGIDSGGLDEVFEPFYTTKARGLGMGLPMARRIVNRLAGRLQIDSQPGRGTHVHLHLPRRSESP